MRILLGVLAIGNGHITRAVELYPELQKYGEVDVLISGSSAELDPPFPVKYRCKGLNFLFGKNGGINVVRSALSNNIFRIFLEYQKIPIEDYDLVVTDMEPISAWLAQSKQIPCIGISNQYTNSIVTDFFCERKTEYLKQKIIPSLFYSLMTPTNRMYGYHYEDNHPQLFTPIIRQEIRELNPVYGNHYTAYLTSFSEWRIKRILSQFPDTSWEVFCKHTKKKHIYKNMTFFPLGKSNFLKSFATCKGIICNSGFGTTSEAIFLKKKILTIPMKHFEQEFNAYSLDKMGAHTIPSFKKKHIPIIEDWLQHGTIINKHYPENTDQIAKKIYKDFQLLQEFKQQ